jgi:hypothetical protein
LAESVPSPTDDSAFTPEQKELFEQLGVARPTTVAIKSAA